MAVSYKLAPIPKDPWPSQAFSVKQIEKSLDYWREHLLEHKDGGCNTSTTMAEVRNALDKWLDERLDLRGR